MRTHISMIRLCLPVLLCCSTTALGQTGEPQSGSGEDVFVTGQRVAGSIVDQVDPIAVLDAAALRSIGATNFKDLLQRLSPLTGSTDDGATAYMLNGRRISGYSELDTLPPEAIDKVEVLPEGEAARLGFPAGTRVTNLITKRRFRAVAVAEQIGVPTESAGVNGSIETNLTRLDGPRRFTLTATRSRTNPILQTDRDIVPEPFAGDPIADSRAFRTLQPRGETVSGGAVLASRVGRAMAGSIDVNAQSVTSMTLSGLASMQPVTGSLVPPGGDYVLRRTDRRLTLHAGGRLEGNIGRWSWVTTGSYDQVSATTRARQYITAATFMPEPAATEDRHRTTTGTVQAGVVANGTVARVPAGAALVTVTATYARSASAAQPSAVAAADRDVARTTGTAVVNAELPLASAAQGVLSFLGQLNVNATLGVSAVTGTRSLLSSGYGLFWVPIRAVRFTASVQVTPSAPDIARLTDPVVTVPGIPFFDFTTGTSVFVDTITGGRADLRVQRARRVQLGVAVRPFNDTNLRVHIDYLATRTTDRTITLGTATPAVQTAFPDAIVRDAAGRLVSVDLRPLNIAS